MAYLGYKRKAYMEYMREQEKIKMWKAEYKRKQLKLKRRKDCLRATVVMTLVAILMVLA